MAIQECGWIMQCCFLKFMGVSVPFPFPHSIKWI